MGDKHNSDSFSFENDPGALSDKDDMEFTFSDIPVLGNEKKSMFSFDDVNDKDPDPSVASFEALLMDQPESGGENQAGQAEASLNSEPFNPSASTVDIQRIKKNRAKKRKKKLLVIGGAAGALLVVIIVALLLLLPSSESKTSASSSPKQMTPEERAALASKRKHDHIKGLIESADALLDAGEIEKAKLSYEKILNSDSMNPDALTGLGRCCEKLKDLKGAEENYRKAVAKKSSRPDPYFLLASLLIKNKETDKARELLEKGAELFPKSSEIKLMTAGLYSDSGDAQKALELYRQVDKGNFSAKDIRIYGKLLEQDSKSEAATLYEYAGRKFRDFKFFVLAGDLTESNDEKIRIFESAMEILPVDDKNKDDAAFLLARALADNGDKIKALEILQDIEVKKLDKKYCSKLIKLAIDSGVKNIENYCMKLIESNPDEVGLQESILDELKKTLPPEKLLEIYSKWWTSNSNNPVANYLYAKVFGRSSVAIKYYRRAVELDPDFYEAVMALVEVEIQEDRLQEAEKYLKKAISIKSRTKNPHKLLAVIYARKGKGREGLKVYSKYLESTDMTHSEKILELIDIAMLMPSPFVVDKYLAQLKEDPKMSEEYRINNAKRKLIFGGASDADFAGPKQGGVRKYYILYLLSKGRDRKVMNLPTPSKDEYPEFWKIYLMRKKGLKWKSLAELYYKKNLSSANPAVLSIIALWLNRITVQEAESKIKLIPYDSRGLYYALIAEEYARHRNKTKADIRFRKAISSPRSIYGGLIKHLYSNFKKYKGRIK